ncbi:uncharacterized protein HKW66_Vig0232170 [Vigna angularis]|uniref:Uncharacterized protein n=1 Tax=Phaseolus angularis TaxID=3914 RepID=A0A8T0KAW2_PHAAN|nr:uncharacterized protein HKW66_Vig0232170 [Vigna angularis]
MEIRKSRVLCLARFKVSNGLTEKKIDDDEFGCGGKSLSVGYVGHGGDLLMVHEEDDGGSEARLGSLMMVIVV